MDYSREYSGNVVHVIPGTGPENWMPSDSSSVWATEEDYRAWDSKLDGSPSNSNYQSSQSRSGSEPPSKKSKSNSQELTSKKTIGKMFFKTKLCCKFRAGTCPYVTNCNFAHSIEELRRPPPNWQEIVAQHEEDKGGPVEIREEFQIPTVVGFAGETQRSYKGRHCKKFYTEEGCPYGDNCTFLHDEQSKNRESVAISLGPGGYGGGGGGGGGGGSDGSGVVVCVGGGGGGGGGTSAAGSANNVKPSNWKTRICNKWELTGYCPFGSKCHFAHGAAELHRYGGGLMESDSKDPSDSKQAGVPGKAATDTMAASVSAVPHSDVYLSVPSQRSSIILQRPGQRHQKWKGPNKISRIYGDWIDDIE